MTWTLDSLETTAGYLHACPIKFSPGLNCIIGARGTCKSTIVETVRFVFDSEPDRVRPMLSVPALSGGAAPLPRAGLIVETLAGGTARCTLARQKDPADPTYVLERNIQSPTRVFRDGVQQIDGSGVQQRIEIYSQGDLQTIAEQPQRRLALIDRPNQRRVDELAALRKRITGDLKNLGHALRERRPEIDSREAKVRELEAHRRQLADVQANRPALSPSLEAERQAYDLRRKAYERLRVAVEARERAFANARTLLADEQALRDGAEFANTLEAEAARSIGQALNAFAESLADVRATIEKAPNLGAAMEQLAAEHEKQSAHFYDLRKEQQSVNEALKTEDALRTSISSMETTAAELGKLREDQARDLAHRADLRAQRDAAADELYALRLTQVEAINAEYGRQIVLTLQQGALTEPHRKLVEELLQRSNLRNQAEVARDLAERVRASDLVDIVEAGDAKRLADSLGRDIGQMTRLIGHLVDNSRLFDLETIVPEDGLEITMVVRGEPRSLNQLSKGQMATALLPLILRDADHPLIVDQPEDDLDNAFVFHNLIDRIKSLSAKRQLIFVTHNANIPVLGDAQRIIVMEMDGPRKAAPCGAGTVDERKADIIRILEGGKEAFKTRHERYAAALG
ncbi:MAG: AAA family ATPase [Phycisphaerales bacterium]